jgi:type II secretory pathway pseudopilin PulG
VSINKKAKRTAIKFSVAGFTLIEILIIILILGIFSAIAAPSWLAFINNQNLRTSQDRIYWAIRIAQSNAKRDKISWQASFREQTQRVQWSVHPANIPPAQIQEIISDQLALLKWHSLPQKIIIDTSNTTLDKVNPTNNQRPSGNVYR